MPKITLESGIDQTLSEVGYNFLYKGGIGDIRVKLLENNGNIIEDSKCEVGEQLVDGRDRFEQIVIKNIHTETQTIEYEVGSFRRENTREGSSVAVISLPDVTVASAPENNQKYFGSASAVTKKRTATGVEAFVLPAANVSGVIVYFVQCTANSANTALSIEIATSAPTSLHGGDLMLANNSIGSSGDFRGSDYRYVMPLFIKAGVGVYGVHSGASGVSSIMYEVL